MYFLDNTFSGDAPFNLALEEVLFNTDFDDDILYLWQNKNAVIIGRNQFTFNEINPETIKEDEVQVVRRNSGGGAVYHDLGNLNYSYITKDKTFDFYGPAIKALNALGLKVQRSGRNDLTINNKKFSGTAVYERGDKILYHGTLLVRSDLSKMPAYLNVSPTKLSKRHISSVASRVVNLKEFLPDLTIRKLKDALVSSFSPYSNYKPLKIETFVKRAEELANLKYRNDSWNYGSNLKNYTSKSFNFNNGEIRLFYLKKDGIIKDVRFYGDFFSRRDIGEFEVLCKNKTIEELKAYSTLAGAYFTGLSSTSFLQMLNEFED